MNRFEEDYELLSDAARMWVASVVYFWAGVVGIVAVGGVVGLVASAFVAHPVLSSLAAAALIVWVVKWVRRRSAQAQNVSDGE